MWPSIPSSWVLHCRGPYRIQCTGNSLIPYIWRCTQFPRLAFSSMYMLKAFHLESVFLQSYCEFLEWRAYEWIIIIIIIILSSLSRCIYPKCLAFNLAQHVIKEQTGVNTSTAGNQTAYLAGQNVLKECTELLKSPLKLIERRGSELHVQRTKVAVQIFYSNIKNIGTISSRGWMLIGIWGTIISKNAFTRGHAKTIIKHVVYVSHQQSSVKKHVQKTKHLALWHLSVCGFDIHEAVGDQLLVRRARASTPSQKLPLLILVINKRLSPK